MSVLIKGMEMPALCQECDLYIDGACYAKGYRDYQSIMDMSKPADCPLIEVTTPHGRLIDGDALKAQYVHGKGNDEIESAWISNIRRAITKAHTVIEAEE